LNKCLPSMRPSGSTGSTIAGTLETIGNVPPAEFEATHDRKENPCEEPDDNAGLLLPSRR
jgi:hypothetical protein